MHSEGSCTPSAPARRWEVGTGGSLAAHRPDNLASTVEKQQGPSFTQGGWRLSSYLMCAMACTCLHSHTWYTHTQKEQIVEVSMQTGTEELILSQLETEYSSESGDAGELGCLLCPVWSTLRSWRSITMFALRWVLLAHLKSAHFWS